MGSVWAVWVRYGMYGMYGLGMAGYLISFSTF